MIDLTMMRLIHAAIRRDLQMLGDAVERSEKDEVVLGRLGMRWGGVRHQLHHHHQTEDERLWPLLRASLADAPAELALLDEMEAEHEVIDPLLAGVDAVMPMLPTQPRRAAEALTALTDSVSKHLGHEEADAMPLIARTVSEEQWQAFQAAQRRSLGLRGAAITFPWLLEDADPTGAEKVLDVLPQAIRLAYRLKWEPAYRRRIQTGRG